MNTRKTRRHLALAVTTALGLGLLATPTAFAADPAPSQDASTAPALTGTAKAVYDAKAKAKATGQAVTIDELTTDSTETVANPDGTLSSTSHAQAVRTKRGTSWAGLDATLHANSDGTIAPAVTSSGLTLSGGGTGPLATVATADGKKLAVTAPFALPAPTLSGSTATYAAVLPDVDLQVTALPNGGWRDVIIVRTAAAAANPKLAKLHFPVQTTGLNVTTDKAGNVSLKDSTGAVRMHAPTAFQWDSSAPAPTAAGATPKVGARSMFAAPSAADSAAGEASSSAEGPGVAATVTTMATSATSTGIDLTPDQNQLGKGTGPWYLDPTVSVDGGTQVSAQVQENFPNTGNVNTLSSLGIGYCGYSDCNGYGRYRSYFQLAIPSVLTTPDSSHAAPTVYNAFFYANANSAASTGTNSPIGLYWTGPIDGTTTWNHQPCGTGSTMQGCSQVASTFWLTNTGQLTYDVSGQMAQAVSGRWSNWTVALEATDEYEKLYRHHLDNNPHITVNYDIAPTIWWSRSTPTPGFANSTAGSSADCPGSTNPGWVGSNQTFTMDTNHWSPIGANVATWYHLWDTAGGGYDVNPNTAYLGSYTDGPMQVDATGFADGHTYQWEAQAADGWLASTVTPRCYFRVDKTPPTVSLSSQDFPPTNSLNTPPKLKAGQTGTFTLGGTDPVPNGGNASGLACFRWSNNSTPVTGWKCSDTGDNINTGIVAAGTQQLSYKPVLWGTNVLYVQSQDNAGNYSQPLPYSFYAPWDPNTVPVPGDLNGDGHPDLLQPDSSGNLRQLTVGKDPTTASTAPIGLAPQDGTSTVTWNDLQTTHRGTLRAWSVDDVFARTTKTPTLAQSLFLYQNDGKGTLTTRSTIDRATSWADATTGAETFTRPADYAGNWSNTTQMVALGALKAHLVAGNESDMTASATSLLTVENGNLWLHRSYGVNQFDADAVKVSGNGTWANYDLIAPGAASGYAQPTLWSRNRTNGQMYAYVIKTKADGTLDLSGLSDPTSGYITNTGGVYPSVFPTVGSSGDLNNDGIADLWAVNSNNHLVFWLGTTADNTAASAVNGFSGPIDLGDVRGTVDRLPLTSGTTGGTTPDTRGLYPGTVKSGVSFAASPDQVAGANPTVATFNGTNTAEIDSALKVDTTKSFTISAWVKPHVNDGVVFSQDGATTSNFMLWPATISAGYVNWHFAMANSDGGTNWPYDQTDLRNASARVQLDTWAKLVVSYDAGTGQMALYVNGTLAATGMHRTTVAAVGSLVIGRYRNNSASSNFFNGSVSDVAVYDYPTNPWSATVSTPIVSGVSGTKCIDDQNAGQTNVNPIEIYDCNGTPAQQWTMNPVDNSLHVMGGCLDDTNGLTANGSTVAWYTCNSSPSQQWLLRADGSIYNPTAGRCLDDPGGNVTNTTRLQLYDCNGTAPQRWTVAPRSS